MKKIIYFLSILFFTSCFSLNIAEAKGHKLRPHNLSGSIAFGVPLTCSGKGICRANCTPAVPGTGLINAAFNIDSKNVFSIVFKKGDLSAKQAGDFMPGTPYIFEARWKMEKCLVSYFKLKKPIVLEKGTQATVTSDGKDTYTLSIRLK